MYSPSVSPAGVRCLGSVGCLPSPDGSRQHLISVLKETLYRKLLPSFFCQYYQIFSHGQYNNINVNQKQLRKVRRHCLPFYSKQFDPCTKTVFLISFSVYD